MAGYLGASPVPQTIQKKESFTATAGQTTFNTTGYTSGNFINVFLNGVRLVNGTDYTATNGSDIVLGSAAAASDVLDFETFNEFSLVDHEFTNSIALKNATHEDTDGGRESKLSFKGEQSGGESSTLAEIQASHDGTADDQKGDLIFKTNDGSDNNAPTERARIDSSGDLLVGKTTTAIGTAGSRLIANGQIQATASGNEPYFANRLSSDGVLFDFRKDGTTVGTIGNSGTALVFENPNANSYFAFHANNQSNGIFYQDGTSKVFGPYVARDDEIDLGASNARWKDLYLSGGVVFDTVAGNATSNTLSDYEEGSFTPTYTSASGTITTTVNVGRYVKVGNLVHCNFNIRSSGVSGISGAITISGMPFTAHSPSRAAGSIWYMRSWGAALDNLRFGITGNTSNLIFYTHSANATVDDLDNSDFHTGSDNNVLECSITYRTS